MEETQLDIELIKKKAISGVVTFTLRTFFVQIFTFISVFFLTIILDPRIFGVFFLVSAFINFLVYFSDIGLAAALIQKKENITKNDLKTTFTVQQAIIMSLVLLGLVFSQPIANFYKLDPQGLFLFRALILSLVLSSLKTIPSIILERKLDFTKLVIPQIAENITFYSVAIILAINNFGIASFTWAVIARGLVGLTIIYALSPWIPRLGIDKKSFKSLTSFGIPFQMNSVMALIKDDLLTIFLGKILTLTQIGYVGWAQKWAFTPLRFFMDSVNKITFPAYSRLQEHRKELSAAIEKSVFFVTYFVYPSVFGMAAIVGNLIDLVPRYQKWEPALPLLYLFFINALFSAVSTTLTNTLFAIGRAKVVLKLMFFWTSATWILTYPLVLAFGYVGVAAASALVSATSIMTLYFVKKEVDIKVAKNIIGPLSTSILMYFIVTATLNIMPKSFISILTAIIIGISSYFVMSLVIFKNHIVRDAKSILKALIIKK